MNWEEFYKKPHIKTPSDFAKFCAKRLPKRTMFTKRLLLLDAGCGNGRDSYFFAKNGWNVMGYDPAVTPKSDVYCYFTSDEPPVEAFDIVYSRFLLHAVPQSEVMKLIHKTDGYFVAEARVIGDKPVLYKNHKRWLVDPDWLLGYLTTVGFEILYFEKGRDMAQYKKENPLVMRVIAKRRE